MIKKKFLPILALVSLLAFAGCSEDSNPFGPDTGLEDKNSPETTIVDVALSVNAETGEFSTLIAALVSADLVGALDNPAARYTVFAPTDAAFAALGLDADNIGDLDTATLTDILLYHVAKESRLAADVLSRQQILMLNGDMTSISLREGMAYIDESSIIQTDVEADNGVIHIIDAVLLPMDEDPGFGDTRPEATTIVDVALAVNAETGEFSTLIAALVAADLVGALNGEDVYTVFAPTDAAFANIGLNADNIGDLDTAALTDILLYHVASGSFMASDVVGRAQILMLNGDLTSISLRDGMAYIDQSNIVQTDVMADNGIIHIIDAVLLPDAEESATIAREMNAVN